MGILTTLTSLCVVLVTKRASSTPRFFLRETNKRYQALKKEILERTKSEHHRIILDTSAMWGAVQSEVAALRLKAAVLYEEAAKASGAKAQAKQEEAKHFERQALIRLHRMPSTPDVLRSRFKAAMEETAAKIDSLAEAEARKEERAKIAQEGELIHTSLNGLRKVYYFRSRYFISGCSREDFWMTDSLEQLTKAELKAVTHHKTTARYMW